LIRTCKACFALLVCLLMTGCVASNVGPTTLRGSDAYAAMPAHQASSPLQDYVIGPLDTLNVTVFQEPDLSIQGLVVDASGGISLPLIGRIEAVGHTATELSRLIESGLSERHYLRRPQVTVIVATSVSQRVTVQGQVTQPGVYPLRGPTTLLDAVALAQGETRTAQTSQVVVIRYQNGQRMAAAFDLTKIRRGELGDPAILGNDIVIVGYSNAYGLYHDLLQSLVPLVAVFRLF
jgi:polysaccharide export outer membrane protein